MTESTKSYVYVYVDPRNYEEFYYGKGTKDRKLAHLDGNNEDNRKDRRIKAIEKAGLKPIIKVIASGLNDHDAHLIETTLIWKLGRTLDNSAAGHFAQKFRPHNTMHLDLKDFDFGTTRRGRRF